MIEVNKIYCENCMDTMQRIENDFIDLVVTSPPYDNLRNYKGYIFPFEEIAKELFRVIKPGGVVVWVVNDAVINGSETGTSFKQALYFKEIGFNLHDTMIYKDSGLTMNHNRYEQEFEFMFVFSNGKPKTFNPIKVKCLYYGKDSDRKGQFTAAHDEKNKKLRANKERGNGFGKSTTDKIAFDHPAIFPEKLAADHIFSWSNENDIVYDPFSGSGTTAKMCHILKRKWIGSEISKEYVDLSTKRIEPYLLQQTIF